MNTMVGMQASLHRSIQDIEVDLTMKNESEPISMDDMLDNDDDEFGGVDPEEILRSPPFNESNQQQRQQQQRQQQQRQQQQLGSAQVSLMHEANIPQVMQIDAPDRRHFHVGLGQGISK
jgi:hypothetical protein